MEGHRISDLSLSRPSPPARRRMGTLRPERVRPAGSARPREHHNNRGLQEILHARGMAPGEVSRDTKTDTAGSLGRLTRATKFLRYKSESAEGLRAARRFSKPPPSATRPPLRGPKSL